MKCYYDNDVCGGPLWECFGCGESYCQQHGHNTSEGTNVECTSCEIIRLEKQSKDEPVEIEPVGGWAGGWSPGYDSD